MGSSGIETAAEKEKAVALLAAGEMSVNAICKELNINPRTLYTWRKSPKFIERVEKAREEIYNGAIQRAVTVKAYRISMLADRHGKLLQVINERSADPVMAAIAGGKTGLIVRKPIASMGEIVGHEYAVDTGLLKELRMIEEQVAKELGQIVEKHEVTGKDGAPMQVAVMSVEQIDAELRAILGNQPAIIEAHSGSAPASAVLTSGAQEASGGGKPPK